MWTHTASITAIAAPQGLWRLFEDVAGWTRWNAGIERTAPHGPFATGSLELQPLPSGGTRVTHAIRVEGPEAATLGPLATAGFPEVLAALKALAEHEAEGES